MQDSLITAETSVLDYGCGQGDDVRRLQEQGIPCVGWDPFFSPSVDRQQSDVVNLGYVVNVIENAAERAKTVNDAWSLAKKLLIISARLTSNLDGRIRLPFADGYLTRRGTFQSSMSSKSSGIGLMPRSASRAWQLLPERNRPQ